MANTKAKIAGTAGGIAAAVTLILPAIQQWEGNKPRPYRDVVGVLTVCSGHTGSDIVVNKAYTDKECKVILDKDITKFTQGVLAISPELESRPYILASTISFSYNVGLTTYRNSSVAKNFKAGQWKAGCDRMLAYTYAGGKYIPGLANRRKAEHEICMKGV